MRSWFFLCFPRCIAFCDGGSGRGEEPGGAKSLRLIQIRLATPSLAKIAAGFQDDSRQGEVDAWSSRNAVSFSSARNNKASSVLTLCGHNPKLSALVIGT